MRRPKRLRQHDGRAKCEGGCRRASADRGSVGRGAIVEPDLLKDRELPAVFRAFEYARRAWTAPTMPSEPIHIFVETSEATSTDTAAAISEAAAALRRGGFQVKTRVRPPARAPQVDVLIQILDAAEDHLIDAAVGAVVASLAGLARTLKRRRRRAQVVILGPRGEPLRVVTLPSEPETAEPPDGS